MRRWLGLGVVTALVLPVLVVEGRRASADACGLVHPPGYADRVNAALQSGRDVWGEELINSPLGPTYAGASSYLAPMGVFHDPGGGAPKTGMHYVAFGQPDLTSSDSITNPFGDPTPSPEVWTGGNAPWTSTVDVALHVADGSEFFSNYMLPTNYETGLNSNEMTIQVGATGSEIYGSCQGRLQMGKLSGGMPILTTAYTDGQGMEYQQESFAVRVPEVPSFQGYGNLASFIKLTVRRGSSTASRANVNFAMGNVGLTLDAANRRLVDNNNPRAPGQVDVIFSPGATYASPSLNYSIDVADGQPHTIYLVRLNEPSSSVAPGLVADSQRYQAARDSIQAYWNGVLSQGATYSVPDADVMDAQRNLLLQSLLLGLNYSVSNYYGGMQFIPEDIWPLTTLGEYGFGAYEELGLQNSRDYFEHGIAGPGPRAGFENMFKGVKMESAAEWYWRTRDAADFDRFFTPLFSQWASDFQRQMAENNGLLRQEPWSADFGSTCYALPYTHAHAWRGLAAVVQVWKSIAADAGLAGTYDSVATQLGQNITDAIASAQTTLSDGSVFVPPCVRNTGTSPDPYSPQISATEMGAYWNIVMPDLFASGLIVPKSAQATGILRYLETHGSRLLGLLRFGPYGTNTTPGADNVYLWNVARFLADNDRSDQLALTLYGLLAAGMSPGTYSSGEGSTIAPVPGEYYRQISRPPNPTTSAAALEALRLMLVHTTTAPRGGGNAGAPTGLELAFGTARPWLAAGKQITVSGAPTAFGPVSYRLDAIANERVTGTVDVPPALGGAPLDLRVRRPAGLTLSSVTVNGAPHGNFDAGSGTIDLSGRSGHLTLEMTFTASQGGPTTTVASTTTVPPTTSSTVPSTTTSTPTSTPPAGGAPTNLRVTSRTSSTAGIAWNPVAGASEYRAYVSRTPGSGYFLWASGFTGTSATLYSLSGDFYVVVRAVVGGQESGNSNEVLASADGTIPSTTTTVPPPTTSSTVPSATTSTSTTTPPPSGGAPTNLRVTSRTSSTAGIAWNPVPGASEYRAYVSRSPGSGYFLWASGFTGSSATLYSLTGDFYVVVRAVVGGQESGNSNEVLASADGTIPTTTTTVPPPTTSSTTPTTSTSTTAPPAGGAPTNLRVTSRTSSTAGIAWNPVPGASEYRAYVSRSPGSGYFLWASGFTGSSATLYSLTGDFYVVVRAVVGGQESGNSNEVLAKAP